MGQDSQDPVYDQISKKERLPLINFDEITAKNNNKGSIADM